MLGYKAVVRDALASDELTDSLKDLLGNAMHRTAADLSCALLRTYEFYTDAPAKAWYELNQLYRLADDLGIATNAYSDEQSRGGGMLTLADVYLRIALLAVAKPNQLRQKDLSAIFNALDQWTPRITIGAPADDTMFVVDLGADSPPSYRELGSHTGDQLRGIRTDVLVYELEAYLAEMASDVPVPDYIGLDLLRHLAHAWGVMKKRSFRRSRSSGPMKICVGLRTMHYYICGGVEFADQLGTTEALLRREINPFMQEQAAQRPARPGDVWDNAFDLRGAKMPMNPNIDDPSRILLNSRRLQTRDAVEAAYPYYDCEILDTSPSGYCVRWMTPLPNQLQTGELLAIRERDDARWCIAVSRWIRHSEQETLMGIELLAPKAIPIARTDAAETRQQHRIPPGGSAACPRSNRSARHADHPAVAVQRVTESAAQTARNPGDGAAHAPRPDDRKFYPVHIPNAGWLLGKHPDRPEHGLAVEHDRGRSVRAAPKGVSEPGPPKGTSRETVQQ